MPTEDYSNTSRTAKLRQKASLKGLNKVARALDYDTQLSMKLGGVVHKTKNSSGISYDCACPPNGVNGACVGTFQEQDVLEGVLYQCDGNQCVGPVGASLSNIYPQINAIPGTTTVSSDSPVAIVNCTSSPVTVNFLYYKMPDGPNGTCQGSGLVGILQPGNCFIYISPLGCRLNQDEYIETIYTFSQESALTF